MEYVIPEAAQSYPKQHLPKEEWQPEIHPVGSTDKSSQTTPLTNESRKTSLLELDYSHGHAGVSSQHCL